MMNDARGLREQPAMWNEVDREHMAWRRTAAHSGPASLHRHAAPKAVGRGDEQPRQGIRVFMEHASESEDHSWLWLACERAELGRRLPRLVIEVEEAGDVVMTGPCFRGSKHATAQGKERELG